MTYTTVENTTEIIWVDLALYKIILLEPILYPIISKPDLVFDLLIPKSTNTVVSREVILFCTHILFVATIVCPNWSSTPTI